MVFFWKLCIFLKNHQFPYFYVLNWNLVHNRFIFVKPYVGIFRKISGIFFCNDWNRRSKLPQRRGNFDRIFELFFQPTYMLEFPDFWKKIFYLSYSVYILRYSSSMTSLDCQSKKNVKKRSKLPQLTVFHKITSLIIFLVKVESTFQIAYTGITKCTCF